jgi:plastocyanin
MKRHWLMPALCAASALLALGCGSDSSGPSNPPPDGDVMVENNFYSPATLSVTTGTTVTWAWNSNGISHSVTFSDDDSDIKSSGTFQKTFASAGSFPYHCRVHASMTGTITVTAASGGSSGGGGGGGGGGGMGGGGYGYMVTAHR